MLYSVRWPKGHDADPKTDSRLLTWDAYVVEATPALKHTVGKRIARVIENLTLYGATVRLESNTGTMRKLK